MSRIKPLDLPLIVADGIDQRQHEPGPGSTRDEMGAKGRILTQGQDFLHGSPRPGVTVMFEERHQLLEMSRFQVLQCRIGLEESHDNRLVEFAEDLQSQG